MATRRTRKSKTNADIKPQRQKFIDDNNLKDFQLSKWQEEFIEVAANNRITFTDSVAGVGKSLAALYYACKQYLANPYLNIVVVRTPVEAGKDRIGFLPDDLNAKMEPHFASTRVLLEEFLGKGKVESDLGKRIHFKVPNYMLGSTVRNSIFIIDEAQQLEPMMLKLLLERIGDGTTAIVLGSTSQMYMSDSGGRGALKDAVDRFFKEDGSLKFEGVGYYKYPLEAMMRDDIVKTVIIAYEGEDNE